jgi:hypothetical protein
LLDALRLLDTFARQRIPDYAESEFGQSIADTIAAAEARVRRDARFLVSLQGQQHWSFPSETDNADLP